MQRTLVTISLVATWLIATPVLAGPTVELRLRDQMIEGKPLAWSQQRVLLLGRNGKLWDFAPDEAEDFRKTADRFEPFSQGEMRGALTREFGRQFQVSGTGHYLVVHPAGERDRWAPRFEELYRSFQHYFTARGLPPREPKFPLVAVVFKSRTDFQRYAAREGARVGSGVLGYYSPVTNRIALYDVSRGNEHNWHLNAELIIHEAAHQAAFNTGIHTRFASSPRWVVEGLGTMFEARGVWDSLHYRSRKERQNEYRLQRFQKYASQRRRKGALVELVSSDRLFQADPDAAYAEAWALTFYLAENEPNRYADLLLRTAEKKTFQNYRAPERLQDFREIFGDHLEMVEARMLRFIRQLK